MKKRDELRKIELRLQADEKSGILCPPRSKEASLDEDLSNPQKYL